MNKIILTFFMVLLLTSCLAAVSVFRRIGAEGTFDITVIDDKGKPMPNIRVEGYFPSEYSRARNQTVYATVERKKVCTAETRGLLTLAMVDMSSVSKPLIFSVI